MDRNTTATETKTERENAMKIETNEHGVTIQYNDDGSTSVVRSTETRSRQYRATASFALKAAKAYAELGDSMNEKSARDHAARLTAKAERI